MTIQAILCRGALVTGFSSMRLGQILLASLLVVVLLAVPPAQLYAGKALKCVETTIVFALSCGTSVITSAGNPIWVVVVSGALCGYGYLTTTKCWAEYITEKSNSE